MPLPARAPLPWYDRFLRELAGTCHVGRSAKAAGIDRRTAYQARKEDPDFAAMWQDAKAIGAEVLEDEAVRRAYKGWLEPVFYQGKPTSKIRKFDSGLLTFLLKGAMPDKYRDRSTVDLNAAGHITFGYDDE